MESETVIHHSTDTRREATAPQQFTGQYLPLEQVTRPNLKTDEAAYYLNRAPQTLRVWAMRDSTGPIRPRRIGGLLAWNTAEVKALAGVTL